MRLQEAKECYITGKTMEEIASERIKEAEQRNNKVGLLAYQKRQEELAKKDPVEQKPDNEPDLPEDSRSLVEIKAAISEKAAEDQTWKRLKKEIEEGKNR